MNPMNQVRLQQGGLAQELQTSSIYGIGLNYAEHAAEMQSARPAEPVVFLKPASALVAGGGPIAYPAQTSELHHEVEMVLLLGQPAWQLPLEQAHQVIAGIGVGLDLTLRDRQAEAKAKGRPWALAKGFAGSAPVSDFLAASQLDYGQLAISLEVNGELRQQGNTADMLFSAAELVAYLSTVFRLQRGDLIFTGTPAGVGPLHHGDQVLARLGRELELQIQVV